MMMMNVLALSLVLSSLAAAGVWSPAPQRDDDHVIVRDGHRVIVVEYDDAGKHNTKVSISPPPPHHHQKSAAEEGTSIKDAASSLLPNLGQGISPQGKPTDAAAAAGEHIRGGGELICDAFGKCTEKIASAFGKAKDQVADTANDAKEKAEKAKDKVSLSDTMYGVKDKVAETAYQTKDTMYGVKDKVAETAYQTKDAVGDALGKAKDTVVEKSQDVQEGARQSLDKAKHTAKRVSDDVVTNASDKADMVREKAAEGAQVATETVKGSSSKFINGVKNMASNLLGIASLLGFATAYGMGVWVTFISSYVLARVLPRQQFGVVQSKIYPVYFRAMGYSIGLALLGHLLERRTRLFSSKAELFQAFNLLSSLLMVLVNALYLEPKATKVMFERMRMEKEEGRGRDDFVSGEGDRSRVAEPPSRDRGTSPATAPAHIPTTTTTTTTNSAEEEVVRSRMARLSEKLKKLNANSSLINVLTLMALTWHLVYLGQRLGIKC